MLHKTRTLPALAVLVVLAGCALSPDPRVVAATAEVQRFELERHVATLCALGPRPAGYAEATERTLLYLESELGKWGYRLAREPFGSYVRHWHRRVDDEGRVSFAMTMQAGVQHNLIAEKLGTTDPAEVVEVGAHYDTVPFGPGADDNASGVAAMLEVARVLAKQATAKDGAVRVLRDGGGRPRREPRAREATRPRRAAAGGHAVDRHDRLHQRPAWCAAGPGANTPALFPTPSVPT
jgi:hypothetical protein